MDVVLLSFLLCATICSFTKLSQVQESICQSRLLPNPLSYPALDMGFASEKSDSNVYVAMTQSPGGAAYPTPSSQSGFGSLPDLEKQDKVSLPKFDQ